MRRNFTIFSAIFFIIMLIFAVCDANAGGNGTQSNPYTCADVIKLNNPGTKVWIKGYIVGTMNTDKTPNEFETNPPFEYYANVFLADRPDETDTKMCVPVQLKSGSAIRSQLNLVDNPKMHHALLALHGDLLAYFAQPGFKNVDEFIELEPSPDDPEDDDPSLVFNITVSTPGSLQKEFASLDADEIPMLVVKGKLNSDDLIYLNSEIGRMATVRHLDVSEITLDYDGKPYSSRTSAPEGGMGVKYTYNYILSEENYDENLPFDFVAGYTTNCYRNNLANAFSKNKRLETISLPMLLTTIGEEIMYGCENLKSATMPDNITEVGERAFGECSHLVIKEIPSTVEKIGDYAFSKVTIEQNQLKFDRIFLGKGAFSYAKGFQSLEITNPNATIPYNTFNHCADLREIKLGEGLKYIADGAFKKCKIQTAELPSSLREIGADVFLDCPFLNSLPVEENVRYIGSIAYDLTDKNCNEYTVREGTTMLAPQLFLNIGNARVNLPASLEIIGKQSMSGINISTLPELPNLKRIDDRAFEFCPLTSIVFPEKLESIYPSAFMNCDKVWKIIYMSIHAEADNVLLFDSPIEQVILGDKVEYIPNFLFATNKFITEIKLPASVKSLGNGAFSGCSKLEDINLSDNITEIGETAFYGCESLKKIHWPAYLKSVGNAAFRECTSLESISLPEGLTTLEGDAFYHCSNVKNLYIPSTIEEGENSYYFSLDNPNIEHLTVTCTAETPYNMGWSFNYLPKTTFRVPKESLDKYKSNPAWNGSNYENVPEIIAIETISAPGGTSQTNFGEGVSSDTDLTDTVIGDVYLTLGANDGYDESDGSIFLAEAMPNEYVDAIGDMTPGKSDLANRFNGLVIMAPAGIGEIVVDCQTIGDKSISMKIRNEEPISQNNNDRGDLKINYDVAEDTYIYIYATESKEGVQNGPESRAASLADGRVKIYSIGVNPNLSGIEFISEEESNRKSIIEYWRLDGIKIDNPQVPGIYIGRCSDGSVVKIQVK